MKPQDPSLQSPSLQSHLFAHLIGSCLLELLPGVILKDIKIDGEGFSYQFNYKALDKQTFLSLLETKLQGALREQTPITFAEMMRENCANLLTHKYQEYKAKQVLAQPLNIVKVIKIGNYVDLYTLDKQGEFCSVEYYKFLELSSIEEGDSFSYSLKGLQGCEKESWKKSLKRFKDIQRFHFLKEGPKQQLLFCVKDQEFMWTCKGTKALESLKLSFEKHLDSMGSRSVKTVETESKEPQAFLNEKLGLFQQLYQAFPQAPAFHEYQAYQENPTSFAFTGCFFRAQDRLKAVNHLLDFYKNLGFESFGLVAKGKSMPLETCSQLPESFQIIFSDRYQRSHTLLWGLAPSSYNQWAWLAPCHSQVLLALLLEEKQGLLPLWLHPELFRLLPLTKEGVIVAKKLQLALEKEGISCGIDYSKESLKQRFKLCEQIRIPYAIAIGEEEIKSRRFTAKSYQGSTHLFLSSEDLIAMAKKSLEAKVFLSENLHLNSD